MWECVESERIHSSHVETPRDGEKSPFRCLKSACLSYSTELKEKSDDDDLEFIFIRRREIDILMKTTTNLKCEISPHHRIAWIHLNKDETLSSKFSTRPLRAEEAVRTLNLNPKKLCGAVAPGRNLLVA